MGLLSFTSPPSSDGQGHSPPASPILLDQWWEGVTYGRGVGSYEVPRWLTSLIEGVLSTLSNQLLTPPGLSLLLEAEELPPKRAAL